MNLLDTLTPQNRIQTNNLHETIQYLLPSYKVYSIIIFVLKFTSVNETNTYMPLLCQRTDDTSNKNYIALNCASNLLFNYCLNTSFHANNWR